MPRSPLIYNLPPGTTPQQPNTPIESGMFNTAMEDIEQTFNTAMPVAFGGTGATDAPNARANLAVVGNGTGIGQNPANQLALGLIAGGAGYPKLTVDVTDFGRVWVERDEAKLLAQNGYMKLPNGFTLQWGTSSSTIDVAITLPIPFPNFILCAVASSFDNGASVTDAYSVGVQLAGPGTINLRPRRVQNGGTVSQGGTGGIFWMAVGG